MNALIEARRLAAALAASSACEKDFATLQEWFGVSGGFGPSNKVTVLIDPSILANALRTNEGYANDGSSNITLVPFTGDLAEEVTRAVFVAEMSEIFMDYLN